MRIRLAENFRAIFYAPFYASRALGFHADEGVEVEWLAAATPGEGVAGLLDGTVDLTWGGSTSRCGPRGVTGIRRWWRFCGRRQPAQTLFEHGRKVLRSTPA